MTWSVPRPGVVLAGALVILSAACHHGRGVAAGTTCDSVAAQPPGNRNVSLLPGTYEVTFVATAGPKTGWQAVGRLAMRAVDPDQMAQPSGDPAILLSRPAIGQLNLDVEGIGATRMGDPMAESAAAPGVGVYTTTRRSGERTDVLARVGSGSNLRGPAPIDGGYFTLFIARITPSGIWGTWTSGAGTSDGLVRPDARGRFCAMRLTRG